MALALGAVFTNFVGLFGLTPLYPEVARDLHVGPDVFGELFLIQGVVSTLLQIPAGRLSDRIGRRPVILLGLGFMAAGQALRWQAGNLAIFAVGQLFIGLSSAFAVAPSYALVADAYRGGGRTQAIGVLQASANVGMAAGLVIAGLVSPFIGWRGLSLTVMLLTAIVLPAAALPRGARRSRRPAPGPNRAGAGPLLGDAWGWSIALSVLLVVIGWGGSIFLLPFVARAHSVGAVGGSLLLVPNLIGSFLGGIVAGRWSDRVGPRPPAALFCSAGVLGLLALGLGPFAAWLVLVAGILIGAAISGTLAVAASAVVEAAAQQGGGSGSALGVLRSGQGLGAAIAPAIAGFALVHAGISLAYLWVALLMSAGGVLMTIRLAKPLK